MSKNLMTEEHKLLREAGFSDRVIELYQNKVNVGLIMNPDVALAYMGPCGDTIKIYLRINESNVIETAKFQYVGCAGAASCGSVITSIAKGKMLEEAKKITEQDLVKELNGLPELDCAKLAVTTLQKAIAEYEKKEIVKKHTG